MKQYPGAALCNGLTRLKDAVAFSERDTRQSAHGNANTPVDPNIIKAAIVRGF